ncbi:MAG: c-type cytochrome [Pseudomonadota bacterium]
MSKNQSIAFLALGLALTACGEKSAPPSAPAAVSAAIPADARLAKLYEQTCKTCHSNAGTGAPVAGDTAAWAPRLAQGMPTLLNHTLNGYKGMPPLGSCSDCGEPEFTALINFMATGK